MPTYSAIPTRRRLRRAIGSCAGLLISCHRNCHRTACHRVVRGETPESPPPSKSQQNQVFWYMARLGGTLLSVPHSPFRRRRATAVFSSTCHPNGLTQGTSDDRRHAREQSRRLYVRAKQSPDHVAKSTTP